MRKVAKILLLALVYVVVAKLGLRFASVTSSVTLVWPASGVSLAALLLLGRGYWPGIALGALVANATTPGVGALVASGIAVGNTLEALLGAYLLERSRFKRSLERVSDVLRLVALGAIASTMASAAVGVASLRLGGLIADGSIGSTWRVWWLGDLMGDLVFAPLLLTLATLWPWKPKPWRLAESGALLVALVMVSLLAFGLLPSRFDFPQPYVVFPLLIWAALRFASRGAAIGNFLVSMISVSATVTQIGPFARATLNESLFQLQAFMAIAVLTSLLLGAAVAERARALALRDDFLSIASHELNTPLAAVHLAVVSIGRMLARGDTSAEKLIHRANHAERQVGRLHELVTRLLDSSQIASGQLALVPAPIDLASVVRDVTERFAVELEDTGAALDLRAPESVHGRWDRLRVEVVVSNLISNALKYGENKPITVSVGKTGEQAIIRVKDQGIGIPLEDQRRVFDRFERAVSSLNYAGFGLGLWITKSIVDAMGGTIELSSEVGAGATFTVTLPLSPREPI